MTTAVTQIKKLLGLKFFDGYLGLIEPIEKLITERDELRESLDDVENLLSNNGLLHEDLLTSLHKLLARPDTAQPQLNEIRYVLHGDIQPCTVLYSDDTTTLLRLDEGDIMCETDTIEWSDSVTYRCQELLKGGAAPLRVIKLLAQLVRDERILLNDDALELAPEQESYLAQLRGEYHTSKGPRRLPPYHNTSVTSCEACTNVYDSTLDLCPQCHTPKGPVSLDDALETGEAAEQKRIADWAQNNPSVQLRPKCHTPQER